jgi:uncharacterized protein
MRGEDVSEARVTCAGLAGDRVYAFVDTENTSSFPWMTARKGPEWILFAPRFLDPPAATDANPFAEKYAVEVATPEGETFRVDAAEFVEYMQRRFGHPLRLRFSERSMMDTQPISILGLNTVRALSEETGEPLDPIRFRANFFVDWDDAGPFFEDTLVGQQLRIGEEATVMAIQKDARCKVITIDPWSAATMPKLFECVAKNHAGCVGIYGTVLREGIVRGNDTIYLI